MCTSVVLRVLVASLVAASGTVVTEREGTCLLQNHKKATIVRHNHSPQAIALLAQTNAHRQWQVKVSTLLDNIMSSKGVLDGFIAAQKGSGDACSSRLLDAKRAYDRNLQDVKDITTQIEAREKVLEAAKTDLTQTLDSIKEKEEEYHEDVAACEKEKNGAQEDAQKFKAELVELQQIASPSVRHQEAIKSVSLTSTLPPPAAAPAASPAGSMSSLEEQLLLKNQLLQQQVNMMQKQMQQQHPLSLQKLNATLPTLPRFPSTAFIQEFTWTEEVCQKFVAFMVARGADRALAPEECMKRRTELQEAFKQAYIGITQLAVDANKRLTEGYDQCMDQAASDKEEHVAPLLEEQDESNKVIDDNSKALGGLKPNLDLVRKRTEELEVYIDETLTPECFEDENVSKHLLQVRELIMTLEGCPGAHDFKLEIPTKAKAVSPPAAKAAAVSPPAAKTAAAGSFSLEQALRQQNQALEQQVHLMQQLAAQQPKQQAAAPAVPKLNAPAAEASMSPVGKLLLQQNQLLEKQVSMMQQHASSVPEAAAAPPKVGAH